jgi:uncharacterized membrane protein
MQKNMNLYMSIRSRSWILYLSIFSLIAVMSSLKYHNLHSTVYDMGIYINNFYMISEGYWERLFLSHNQPLGIFWSLSYNFLPADMVPIFILIGQAALLTCPIIGLYRHYGLAPTIAFILYFPLWYNGLFDFHIDHLAVPFLFGFLMMEKKGAIGFSVLFGLLLALVKEIFAIQAIFCGIYLLFIKKHRIGGTILTLGSSVYLFISYTYLNSFFNGVGSINWNILTTTVDLSKVIASDYSLISAYAWLGDSISNIFLTILTKPHWVLGEIFTDTGRLQYLLYLFGALGFIPLLRPSILLIIIPILAVSILSSEPKHYGFTHHYSAGLLIPMIIAFAEGLPSAKKLWEHAKLKNKWFEPILYSGLLVSHILLSSSPIGRKFYDLKAWNYHYSIYIPIERNQMIKTALKNHISPDPNKVVSAQNSLNLGYLMERKFFKVFPQGATEKSKNYKQKQTIFDFIEFARSGKRRKVKIENNYSDYVVLDLKRPWFIKDQACRWNIDKCKDESEFENIFLELVKKTHEKFSIVFEQDGFVIFKRLNDDLSP